MSFSRKMSRAKVKATVGSTTEMMPLTLEQLKQMDGEPVWVSAEENGHYDYCGAYKYGFCAILRTTITHPCATSVYGIRYSFEDYGKTWLAYAHKPGGEQDVHYSIRRMR